MKKIIAISMILLTTMSLAACGHSSEKTPNKSKSQKTAQSFRVSSNGSAIGRADYNRIETGNVTSPKNGTSKNVILTSFGKPNSKSRVTVNNSGKKAAIQYSWTNLKTSFKASALTVEFLNGHAIGKGYIEASIKNRRYISKNHLNNVQKGETYTQVVKRLGVPDAESLTGHGNVSARNVTYATGKNGRALSLMFAGDKLTSKMQTVVK
ncbi:DUF3862 domain-containing protein [Lentilactobacillus hilgardii]|uniref:DUF3862 domain-containing protein n=1 Tax=Lentilactobacillus hilgardii TaxID=1588 RepID=UPI0039ED879A